MALAGDPQKGLLFFSLTKLRTDASSLHCSAAVLLPDNADACVVGGCRTRNKRGNLILKKGDQYFEGVAARPKKLWMKQIPFCSEHHAKMAVHLPALKMSVVPRGRQWVERS